ncbi:MAG TPA: energy transducer TonB, partial [Lysobacter sp.]|nr:energy transducer TonB [Lysobacter sp.]
MVHAHVHPALHAQGAFLFERPSPSRITAISIVVALHVAAFVLLLMPMATPEAPQPRVETVIDILPIRRPEKLEVLPPPPKPERQTRLRNPVRTPAPTPPPYPPEAMRRRIEGTVLLRVLVDVDGRPLDAWVETSSGNRALDEA